MRIGIIGGTKGLGKTIATLLKKENYEVTITGRDQKVGKSIAQEIGIKYSKDNKKLASESDIVIISVPIDLTSEVINEIASSMKKGSLLLDVTSVKLKPSQLMEELVPKDVEVIPTHPVFGPRTNSLNGQVIVLTPKKIGKWYPKVLNFLKKHKMRIIESSPQEHDDMMAIVQILTHFSYISTASAIKKLGVNIKETRKFASPIYNLMVDMIARIVSQNPVLTYSIQLENENGDKTREIFASSVEELKNVLKSKDKEQFMKIAIESTNNMDDIQSALGRSDKAINSLNHEINILKNSIGNEIAIEDIYSQEVNRGILKDINPEFIIIETKEGKKEFKASNIKILNNEELIKWKKEYCPVKTKSISCVFLKNSDSSIIKDTLKLLDNVVDVRVVNNHKVSQIEKDKIIFTFEIDTFNDSTSDNSTYKHIKNLLEGFGAIII